MTNFTVEPCALNLTSETQYYMDSHLVFNVKIKIVDQNVFPSGCRISKGQSKQSKIRAVANIEPFVRDQWYLENN